MATNTDLKMLSVRGSKIVDSDGKPVRLRGVAVGGWMNMEDFITGHAGAEHTLRQTLREHLGAGKAEFFLERLLHHFFNEDDVRFIAEGGANVIRLPLNYRHFENDAKPFEYLESGFQRLERVLGWCERHGLYVILDLHAVQGWQSARWHCDNANSVSLFWTHPHFQRRFLAFWREVARRYKDRAVVAAYELMNEPVTNLPNGQNGLPYVPDWAVMNRIYRRGIEAIREMDTGHIIMLEGDERGRLFEGLESPPDPNLVYSSHNYSRFPMSAQAYPATVQGTPWDRALQEKVFLEHEGTQYARKHGVPLLVGEFGWQYNVGRDAAEARLRALHDQIDVFEQHHSSWVLWTYKDLGAMGWVHLEPDSEYMRMIRPILEVKRAFRADFATKFFGTSSAQRIFQGLLQKIDDTAHTTFAADASHAGITEQTLQNLTGNLLQPSYAKLFQTKGEAEIDHVLSAFALDKCIVRQDLTRVVQGFAQAPQLS